MTIIILGYVYKLYNTFYASCVEAVHAKFMHLILQLLQLSKSSQCKCGAKCELEGHVVLHGRAQINAGKVALQTVVRKETDAQL